MRRRPRVSGRVCSYKIRTPQIGDGATLCLESFLQQNSPGVKVQIFLHCPNGNAQFLLLGEDYAEN